MKDIGESISRPESYPRAPYEDVAAACRWYFRAAQKARVGYQMSEVVILLFAASVPIAGVLLPTEAWAAAVLGAIVTALTGLRAVFHWRVNWNRYAVTHMQLVAELRLYTAGVWPYSVAPPKREEYLVTKVNQIITLETISWADLKGPESENGDRHPRGGDHGAPNGSDRHDSAAGIGEHT